jgi:hypothetical protein
MDAYKPSGVTPSGSNVNMGSSSYLPTANIGGNSVWDTKLSDEQTQDAKKTWEKRNNTPEKGFMESLGDVGSSVVNGIKGVGEFVGNEALGVDDFGWVAKNLAQGNLLEAGKSALAGGLELGGTVAAVLGAIPSGGTSLGWFAAKQGAKQVAKQEAKEALEYAGKEGLEAALKTGSGDALREGGKETTQQWTDTIAKDILERSGLNEARAQSIARGVEKDAAKNAKLAARDAKDIQKATTTRADRRIIAQTEREIDRMTKSTAELADDLWPLGKPSIKPKLKGGKGSGGGTGGGKGGGTGGGVGEGTGGGTGGGVNTGGSLGSEGTGFGPGVSGAGTKVGELVDTAGRTIGRGVDELPPPPRFGPMKPKTNPPKVLPGGTSTGEAVETTVEGALKSDPEAILNPNLMGPQFKNKVLGGLGLVGLTGAGLAVTSGTGAVTSSTTGMGTALTPDFKTPTTFADGTPKPAAGEFSGGGGGGSLPTPTNAPSAAAPSDIPYIY